MSLGIEQARERLRHATAVCAAAETGYWQHRDDVNGEAAATLSHYRERLLEEKHALTGEILSHLGLSWVAPSDVSPEKPRGRSAGELSPAKLLLRLPAATPPATADGHFQVRVPPFATGSVSYVDDQQKQRPHDAPQAESSQGVVRTRPATGDQLFATRSAYEEEGRQAASPSQQQQPKDHQYADAGAEYGNGVTTVWGDRRRSNTENEVPDNAVTPIPSGSGGGSGSCGGRVSGGGSGSGSGGGGWASSQHQSHFPTTEQQQQQSSWRQVKKLDHPRQISPSMVGTLPAVLVESGPLPPAAPDVGHPYKRARKTAAEEHQDLTNTDRVSFYAYNGAPRTVQISETSSRGNSSGFYLAGPVVDSASSTSVTASSKSAYSNHNPHLPITTHDWECEQPPSMGKSADHDDAAAAVRVLGLRNGHLSVTGAVKSAMAATQPTSATAAAVVGSKRVREVVEQKKVQALPWPMPSSSEVNIVRAGGGAGGSPTTLMRHGGSTVVSNIGSGGRRFSTGTHQTADRSSEETWTPAARKGTQACRDVGCHRRPIYAFKGDTKALCCPIHRSEEMVNVRHPLCRHESCFRQPSFGMEGDQRASFCSEHKLPKMINVSSRRCQAAGCLRHPNFGFQGDRRATFCCRHKATGMIDVVSRRCQHPQCVRRPLYAMAGQRAMFCRTHKDPGHTDVVSRRCNFEGGCDRHPSFGWKQGDGKARRCAHHRLEGMESVKVNNRRSSAAAATAAAAAPHATRDW